MFQRWFPESASAVAREIDWLFWYSTAWTAGTGLLVLAILFTFLIIYRKKTGRSAFYTHGNTKGALILTLSLAVLVFLLLDINLAYQDHRVWNMMFGRPPSPAEALKIEIMPEQFAWNIRYEGADNEFGTEDDIVSMNELHVPAGKPVVVQLTSKDVIHSFFLPNLRIKQDAIPGMITTIYFTAEAPGHYNIACAQHCGLGHYRMKGQFIVDEPSDYNAWIHGQMQEAALSPAAGPSWAWDWVKGLAAGGGPAPKKESAT